MGGSPGYIGVIGEYKVVGDMGLYRGYFGISGKEN